LIDSTEKTPEEAFPKMDIGCWDHAVSLPYDDTNNDFFMEAQARHVFGGTDGSITGAIKRHNLDALVTLTDFANHPAGAGGLPVVSVPLGFYPDDTPEEIGRTGLVKNGPGCLFNIAFLGNAFSEEKLIQYAYAFEELTHARALKKPYKLPTEEIRINGKTGPKRLWSFARHSERGLMRGFPALCAGVLMKRRVKKPNFK
jgi:amidase